MYHWRGRYQVWVVGEKEFAAKFASKLSKCLGREVRYYKYGGKNAWFVSVKNADLFLLFKGIRKDPASIRFLVDEIGSQSSWLQFVEGLLDAEGCVKIIKEANRRTAKVCLDVCNTDLGILGIMWRATYHSLGIRFRISRDPLFEGRKPAFHLRIYRKDEVERFLSAIPTTKLTSGKKELVEKWMDKKDRKGKFYLTFPNLDSTSGQLTTFHQASTYLPRSFL